MTAEKAVLVCRESPPAHWGVRPPVSGTLSLIGWRTACEPAIDDGVPDEVALLLARALSAAAYVSFVTTSEEIARAAETASRLEVGTARKVAAFVFGSRISGRYFLATTRRPDVAKHLFSDPGMSWSLQSQVVLLGERGAPALEGRTLWTLHATSPIDFALLAPHGIHAAVMPGVDGDVAGLVSRSPAAEQAILGFVETEARGAGYAYETVSHEAFADRLAGSA